jgi:hypothetical protein
MSVPGQVKTKANKRSADRVFQKRQSDVQKAGTKTAIKYGPYVIGGAGGLGIKAIATMLAGTGLKTATKAGLKKAAQKYFGKSKVDDAIKTTTKKAAKKPATTAKKPATTAKKPKAETPRKTETEVAAKKQVKQLKEGNGVRKAKPPKSSNKPKKKKNQNKTPVKKQNTTSSPGKAVGVIAGGSSTAAGATLLANSDREGTKYDLSKFQANRRRDRLEKGDSRTNRPRQTTDMGEQISRGDRDKTRAGSEIGPSTDSKRKQGMGGKATVSPEQKSRQATLPRDSREDQIGVKIARMLGDKRSVGKMISDREESEKMEEEMNLRRGGSVSKKYGARAGGFTKRGGMYKKGY